jgi:ADP-heptose:LPS heptosyltransferase
VHEVDLTETDKRFIEQTGNIFILPQSDLHDYLVNLYDADMVVTTDTGGLHFREGVGRPALGVFGAMTTGSRTSGYRFTKSFNVKSTCEHQPCFIHERIKNQVCLNAKEGDRVAKCQTGKSFQKQLEQELLKFKQ